MNPTISIMNQSKTVTNSTLKRVVLPAMQKQITLLARKDKIKKVRHRAMARVMAA